MEMLQLRSSQLSRFMTCSGYLKLPQNNSSSQAAEDGTAWHWAIEEMLKGNRIIANVNVAPNGVTIDEEMVYHAKQVVDTLSGYKVFSEYPIKYNPSKFECEITGTCDSWWEEGDTLYVNDYKYGFNLVEVENNWQLLSYAFGVMVAHPESTKFKRVVLSIMQPRPHHQDGWYRSVEYSTEGLYGFYQQLGAYIDNVFTNGPTLQTSSNCKYCSGVAQTCSVFNKSFCASLEFSEQNIEVDKLDNEELNRYLIAADRALEIIKIKKEGLEQVTKSKLNNGEIVGEWRNVESFGHRKWSPTFKLSDVELLSGLTLTDSVVISPAQAEKRGLDKELTRLFTITESRGFKLENKKITTKKLNEVFNK